MIYDKEYYIEQGEYYGYPACCIEDFCQISYQLINGLPCTRNSQQVKAANGSGFVPCKVCAEKVVSGTIAIENLITNRKCTEPFQC